MRFSIQKGSDLHTEENEETRALARSRYKAIDDLVKKVPQFGMCAANCFGKKCRRPNCPKGINGLYCHNVGKVQSNIVSFLEKPSSAESHDESTDDSSSEQSFVDELRRYSRVNDNTPPDWNRPQKKQKVETTKKQKFETTYVEINSDDDRKPHAKKGGNSLTGPVVIVKQEETDDMKMPAVTETPAKVHMWEISNSGICVTKDKTSNIFMFNYGSMLFCVETKVQADTTLGNFRRIFKEPQDIGLTCPNPECKQRFQSMCYLHSHIVSRCVNVPVEKINNIALCSFLIVENIQKLLASTPTPGTGPVDLLDPYAIPFDCGPRGRRTLPSLKTDLSYETKVVTRMLLGKKECDCTLWALLKSQMNRFKPKEKRKSDPTAMTHEEFPFLLFMSFLKKRENFPTLPV